MGVSAIKKIPSVVGEGIRLLICGGGNGAHVLAGIASAQANVAEARVLTLYPGEANRWSHAMKANDFEIVVQRKNAQPEVFKTKPFVVSDLPSEVTPGCNLIVLTVPAFVHTQYLVGLKPYIVSGTSIVGLPGNPGFDFAVRGALGELAKSCSILSFESLPWACRISEYGRSANVLRIKDSLSGAVVKAKEAPKIDPTEMMQRCLGTLPRLQTHGHLLGITMTGINGCLHPAVMYGKWHNWDGKPLDHIPISYNDMDEYTGEAISGVSDEVVATAKALMRERPSVDLSNVSHMYDWYLKCYDKDIDDKTNLYTCIKTNKAYNGLRYPMTKIYDGRYVPDYGHRYLSEDIPFGLVVTKGIAAITGIKTPYIDKVITWAQHVMGKEYLVDGELIGRDVAETRAPQAHGILTLDEMLGLE